MSLSGCIRSAMEPADAPFEAAQWRTPRRNSRELPTEWLQSGSPGPELIIWVALSPMLRRAPNVIIAWYDPTTWRGGCGDRSPGGAPWALEKLGERRGDPPSHVMARLDRIIGGNRGVRASLGRTMDRSSRPMTTKGWCRLMHGPNSNGDTVFAPVGSSPVMTISGRGPGFSPSPAARLAPVG
jgi:hypothetical protein